MKKLTARRLNHKQGCAQVLCALCALIESVDSQLPACCSSVLASRMHPSSQSKQRGSIANAYLPQLAL